MASDKRPPITLACETCKRRNYVTTKNKSKKTHHILVIHVQNSPGVLNRIADLHEHCQALADKIAAFGFIDLPPIAQYHPPAEGVEETYADWRSKQKGEYPLQLYTIHYHRRSHSVFDNIQQLREAFPQEFIMNPIDAEARDIVHGDQVLIASKHGQVVRPVSVSPLMMPGVCTLPEGAWVERDDESGIDFAGATNSLNGTHLTGQGEEPWNTCVVQVEKWTGDPIDPDAQWPQRVIFDVPEDFIVGGGTRNE